MENEKTSSLSCGKKALATKIAVALLRFVFCCLAFFIPYKYYMGEIRDKMQTELLNDSYTDFLRVPSGSRAVRNVKIQGPVCGIGVKLDASLRGEGAVTVSVKDSVGQVLGQREFSMGQVSPTYTVVPFEKEITDREEHSLIVEILPVLAGDGVFSVGFERKEDGNFSLRGEDGVGDISLLKTYDRLGEKPGTAYKILAVIASFLSAGLAVILLSVKTKKGKTARVFATILICGIYYQAVMPPFSAPDEGVHYSSAYNLANRLSGIDSDLDYWLYIRATDRYYRITSYNTTAYTYRYALDHFGDENEPEYVRASDYGFLSDYSFPRLPTAIGIVFCRRMGLNGVVTAYVSRFLNLLVYALIRAAAFRIAPVGSVGFFAVAMLPISLHLGGSYSYDSMLISLSLLIIALILNCRFSESRISAKKFLFLLALVFFFAPIKGAYILLPMLVLLIPKEKFGEKLKHGRLIIVLVAVLRYAMYNLSSIVKIAFAASLPPLPDPGPGEVVYSLTRLLSNPSRLLGLVANTFFNNFTEYCRQLFGGTLGYVNIADVKINDLIVIGFAMVTVFSFLKFKGENCELAPREKLAFIAVFILTLGVAVARCIRWTPVTYDYIWGFQSRYVLPVFPLVLLCLNSNYIVKKTDGFSASALALYFLNILAAVNCVVVVMAR